MPSSTQYSIREEGCKLASPQPRATYKRVAKVPGRINQATGKMIGVDDDVRTYDTMHGNDRRRPAAGAAPLVVLLLLVPVAMAAAGGGYSARAVGGEDYAGMMAALMVRGRQRLEDVVAAELEAGNIGYNTVLHRGQPACLPTCAGGGGSYTRPCTYCGATRGA
uniref:Uncharacterized protein n=1 Tax=Oryza brachyantha TaxID=4533 RepID=J3NEC3_ORYBR